MRPRRERKPQRGCDAHGAKAELGQGNVQAQQGKKEGKSLWGGKREHCIQKIAEGAAQKSSADGGSGNRRRKKGARAVTPKEGKGNRRPPQGRGVRSARSGPEKSLPNFKGKGETGKPTTKTGGAQEEKGRLSNVPEGRDFRIERGGRRRGTRLLHDRSGGLSTRGRPLAS